MILRHGPQVDTDRFNVLVDRGQGRNPSEALELLGMIRSLQMLGWISPQHADQAMTYTIAQAANAYVYRGMAKWWTR